MAVLHYRPKGAWFGDPIPYFWNGEHHIFYLRDIGHHSQPGGRHTWAHISSNDLINWKEHELAIPLGKEGEVDSASCGTGSIFQWGDTFHIFYLGRYINTQGETRETICHAFSKDLISWKKNPNNPISIPDRNIYSPESWRDPFILWNEENKEFWMIVTARLLDKPLPLSGCLALLKSNNLKDWTLSSKPFWAPGISINYECPDIFFWNGWWYLIYSTSRGTFYRMSKEFTGNWISQPVDILDGDFFYAGKTNFDGQRRFLFGWVPTLEGNQDFSHKQWGGHMVVREIVQDSQGRLGTKFPKEFLSLLGEEFTPKWRNILGEWEYSDKNIINLENTGVSCIISEDGPNNIFLSTKVRAKSNTRAIGIFIRTDHYLETGYSIVLDLAIEQIIIRPSKSGLAGKPITTKVLPKNLLKDKEFSISIFSCGSILDISVNNQFSTVVRAYDQSSNGFGFFVQEGEAIFEEIKVNFVNVENNE